MGDVVKIGSRLLSDNEMKILLENYESIKEKINHMRKVAKAYNKKVNNNEKEYLKINNNVFSILGERGTGKSSVLLTIKKNIATNWTYKENDIDKYRAEEKNTYDIILPIILPETMGKNSDMLGCILGIFKEIVDDLEKDIFENRKTYVDEFFQDCRKKHDNILRSAYNEVLEQYRYIQDDYKEILKNQYSNFQDYIEWSNKSLDPENKMIQKFSSFIDILVSVKKRANKNVNESLIFVFLDDVDLSKDRCEEVLDVILRYLSHSNIITFVAGDLDMFETCLFTSYLNKSNLLCLLNKNESALLNKGNYIDLEKDNYKLIKSNEKLARDAIKKIMPPALQYSLANYKNKDKLQFKYKNEETLWNLINKKLILKGNDSDNTEKKWSLEDNFIYSYIFPKRPRSLINIYYCLFNLSNVDDLKDEAFLSNLQSVLEIIINSSSKLSNYEEEVINIIQFNYNMSNEEKNRITIFIDYEAIIDLDMDRHGKVKVFILANFIERIFYNYKTVKYKIKGKQHGWHQLLELININKEFNLFPNIDDVNVLLKLYEKIENRITMNKAEKIINNNIKNYRVKQYFEILSSEKDIMNYLIKLNRYDSRWGKEKYEIIAYHKNPVLLIMNKVINEYINQFKESKIENDIIKVLVQPILDKKEEVKSIIEAGELYDINYMCDKFPKEEIIYKYKKVLNNLDILEKDKERIASQEKKDIKLIDEKSLIDFYEAHMSYLKLKILEDDLFYLLNEDNHLSFKNDVKQDYKFKDYNDFISNIEVLFAKKEWEKCLLEEYIRNLLNYYIKKAYKADVDDLFNNLYKGELSIPMPSSPKKYESIQEVYSTYLYKLILFRTLNELDNIDEDYYMTFLRLHDKLMDFNSIYTSHYQYLKDNNLLTIKVKNYD